MKKSRITVTMDAEIEKWLRPEASFTGKSISHLIRICLQEYYELQPDRFSRKDKARTTSEKTFQIPSERLAKR
jgi:hypothetical protein